jgi:hypothetical protein
MALFQRLLNSFSRFDHGTNNYDTYNEIFEFQDSRSRILVRTQVAADAAIRAQTPQ